MFHSTSLDERPLPERVRPQSFQEFIDPKGYWSKEGVILKIVESDSINALLLWGPPGTGKTSLAQLIAQQTERILHIISAVHGTVKDIRAVIEASVAAQAAGEKGHILFVDEIHRFTKTQQDALLPSLERGHIRFIGATTENPSFTVNQAILSRCLCFELPALSEADLVQMQRNALETLKQSYSNLVVHDQVLTQIAASSQGDGRRCLNLLSTAISLAEQTADGLTILSSETLEKLKNTLPIRYDHDGEQHYDLISAFIKSIRASHPDAALYYLARMLEGGEDPRFIARRLLISASEDVGNANPTALLIAQSTFQAAEAIGMPEIRITLGQCTTYLASSPKSNKAYIAIDQALEAVRKTGPLPVPMHLRNAPTKFMKDRGYGKNYAYAHDNPSGARESTYLPPELAGVKFYEPSEIGTERQLKENLKHLRPTKD